MASLRGREPDACYVRLRESFAAGDSDGARVHRSTSAPTSRLELESRIGAQAMQRLLQWLRARPHAQRPGT